MSYHIEFDIDFKRNKSKGLYIAVEGIDGSGKTTQVTCLAQYFKQKGKEVVITSEPKGDLIVGKLIRDVLQSKIKIPSPALQYLYSADRVINHETIVKPALEQGKIVLSHRVFWSAIPYGVMDKIMDQNGGTYDFRMSDQITVAQGILSMYHQFITPDVTFYLDVSVETALSRLSHMQKTKEIYEKKEKLEKIREGYRMLLEKFPKEFFIIDGEKSEEEVTKAMIQHLTVNLNI